MARTTSKNQAEASVEDVVLTDEQRSRRGGEITGLVLLSLSITLFLAIFSFVPSDIEAAETVQNWIGPVGAYAADILLYILGVGALVLSGVIFMLGGFMLVGRRPELKPSEFVGYGLFVFAGALFCHLLFAGDLLWGHQAGGLVGALLGEFSVGLIGEVGTYVLSVSIVLLALMLVTDMSLGNIVLWLGARIGFMFRGVTLRWRSWREFRRRLREERSDEPHIASDDDELERLVEARLCRHYDREAEKEEAREARRAEKARRTRDSAEAKPRKVAVVEDDEDEEEEEVVRPVRARKPERVRPVERVRPEKPRKAERPRDIIDSADEDDESSFDDSFDQAPPAGLRPEPAVVLPGQRWEDSEDDDSDDDSDDSEDVSWDAVASKSAPATPPPAPLPTSAAKLAGPADIELGPQIVETPAQASARERRDSLAKAAPAKLKAARPGLYQLPDVNFLNYQAEEEVHVDHDVLRDMSILLEKTLENFGVKGKVVEICPGPVITMFEFAPAAGVKLSKIAGLADDLAMALAAISVRIIAPIPGKGVVGIEVPNDYREMVYLKEIIASEEFTKTKARMPLALGKNTEGTPVVADLAAMPHLLVAGATGAGKSVAVNTMIVSLLYQYTADDVRLIMVDPKMLEFSIYESIPHLLLPVVTDPKKAAVALRWAVEEMETRYSNLSEMNVRNISSYNQKVELLTKQVELDLLQGNTDSDAIRKLKLDANGVPKYKKLPFIVVIIDEFADLMMVASKDVETCVARLAQKARAAGIHLILATQRPSVDVITGLIKANFPTRLALRVAQRTDSRTILDSNGAEHLLGRGDMLFLGPGRSTHQRVHGAYISETEIEKIVEFLKGQGEPQYDESLLTFAESGGEKTDKGAAAKEEEEEHDEFYDQAVQIVIEERSASISMLQRKLRVGYNRAARMVEMMEEEGVVGPAEGARPREVLVPAPA